jgi:hypothetical protein
LYIDRPSDARKEPDVANPEPDPEDGVSKLSRTGDFIVAKFPAPDVRSSAQKQLRQIFVAKWMPDALTRRVSISLPLSASLG